MTWEASYMEARVGSVTVAMRTYFSSHHLWASRHFARLAKDIEDGHTDRPKFNLSHRSYATNAVLSAVAFIEAAINEVFQDAADGELSYIKPLGEQAIGLLAGLWREGESRSVSDWSAIDKYQVALFCAGRAAFERGKPPYQGMRLLIKLRNELTHSRPKTLTSHSTNALTSGFVNGHRSFRDCGHSIFPGGRV